MNAILSLYLLILVKSRDFLWSRDYYFIKVLLYLQFFFFRCESERKDGSGEADVGKISQY